MDITNVRDPKRAVYPPLPEEDLYSSRGGGGGKIGNSYICGNFVVVGVFGRLVGYFVVPCLALHVPYCV